MEKVNLKEHLISVALGIKFRANFVIEDKLGNIVDRILYSRNSFFNPQFFPYVQNNVNEKILTNDKTGDNLKINNSNIILEVNFSEAQEKENLNKIYENFEKQIISGLLKENKITQINRIGHINRYIFDLEKLAKSFLDKTIGKTFEGINDINLRFSRKYPIEEALIKKDINDYHNAIYNIIKRSDREELFISIDYQRYYEPFLESSSSIEFEKFLEKDASYNQTTFLTWLNKNYLGIEHEA